MCLGRTWKYGDVTASVTLCSRCHVPVSRAALSPTREPDWVPATSQSQGSSGICTVTRHRTGLESTTCRRRVWWSLPHIPHVHLTPPELNTPAVSHDLCMYLMYVNVVMKVRWKNENDINEWYLKCFGFFFCFLSSVWWMGLVAFVLCSFCLVLLHHAVPLVECWKGWAKK